MRWKHGRSEWHRLMEEPQPAGPDRSTKLPSAISEDSEDKFGHKEIDHQDQHRRGDHGLGGRTPDTLRSTTSRHPVVATDGGDHKSEQDRLDEAHEYVAEDENL